MIEIQAQESLGSCDELESPLDTTLTALLAHNKVVLVVKAKLAISRNKLLEIALFPRVSHHLLNLSTNKQMRLMAKSLLELFEGIFITPCSSASIKS